MNSFNSDPEYRIGEQYRSNPDRYFHVMTEGWYVFTREGIRGPFVDRNRASTFLHTHIAHIKGQKDPSDSWRL